VLNLKVIPPDKLRTGTVRLEILNALRKEGRLQVRMLEQTTQHWRGAKPSFEFLIGLTGTEAALMVGASGSGKGAQKWQWLDEGTRPHIITPRRAPYLRFQTGGSAGSSPGTLSTRPATPPSGPFVRTQFVRHPGNAARQWSIVLMKERQNPFYEALNDAVKAGLKKAGV
jgi:hypothetical protein